MIGKHADLFFYVLLRMSLWRTDILERMVKLKTDDCMVSTQVYLCDREDNVQGSAVCYLLAVNVRFLCVAIDPSSNDLSEGQEMDVAHHRLHHDNRTAGSSIQQ